MRHADLHNAMAGSSFLDVLLIQQLLWMSLQTLCEARIQQNHILYTRKPTAMSLGCLACNAMEGSTHSFRIEETFQRSLSTRSEEGGACLTGCFARRPAHHHTSAEPSNPQGARVTPISDADCAPRLTRCYAVRRDCTFFRDWSVNQVETATLVG